MDIYDIKNAIFFGFFLSFMIGPVFFMLIQTSIVKGARAAIAFNLGVILKDWSWAHPIYRFEVLKEIKSVEIDPSKLMADIYPSDNKK